MNLRIGILSIILIGLLGCSDNYSTDQSEELSDTTIDENLLTELNNSSYSVVCGVLFKVNDFDQWLEQYKQNSHNLIISLRNVEDPMMVVVFEGSNDLSEAEKRTDNMMDEMFTEEFSVEGNPVLTYYAIKYFQPQAKKGHHFLALSFSVAEPNTWELLDNGKINLFTEKGLVPVGMGASTDNANNKYLLLSLEDIEIFKEKNNSHREIRNFLREMNLPENTVLSYWERS